MRLKIEQESKESEKNEIHEKREKSDKKRKKSENKIEVKESLFITPKEVKKRVILARQTILFAYS